MKATTKIKYGNKKKFSKIVEEVMETHKELFQKLAEVEAKERETNRRKWEKLKSLGLNSYR